MRLKSPAPWPLPAGKVHVHVGGAYVGDTRIDHLAPGAPVEISLGIDESLRLERVDLLERDRKAGIFRRDRKLERAYRVAITNGSTSARSVEIRERLPVSKDEAIKVRIDQEKSTAGYDLDAHRGFVTWRLDVAAGAEAKADLAYTIALPKDWQIQGR